MAKAFRSLLGAPLLHFMLIGAALYVGFGLADRLDAQSPKEIYLSAGQINELAQKWSRSWKRPPRPEELKAMIEDYMREEIYFREALELGLDKDDSIIRNRMRQKYEFLHDTTAELDPPTDEQLITFIAENVLLFQRDALVALKQIELPFPDDNDGYAVTPEELLSRLADDATHGLPEITEVPFFTIGEIEREYGADFAAALLAIDVGKWSGPISSTTGQHLVLLTNLELQPPPNLEEERLIITTHWADAVRDKAMEEFYTALLGRYKIVVEGDATGSGARVSAVLNSSAEEATR